MPINLSDFASGAVDERFGQELQKVLENIADPNTDPFKARKVQLTLTVKGNENRDIASVDIQAKSTLVPARNVTTAIILDQDSKGRVVGAELKSGSKGQLFIDEEGDIADDRDNKVVSINK